MFSLIPYTVLTCFRISDVSHWLTTISAVLSIQNMTAGDFLFLSNLYTKTSVPYDIT